VTERPLTLERTVGSSLDREPAIRAAIGSTALEALRRQSAQAETAQIRAGHFILPAALGDVAARLVESRSILELGDNWDGEGSPGYEEATWQRAAQFVVDGATRFWRSRQSAPPAPTITNGPDGSVDIIWRAGNRKVLINVPTEPSLGATFYSDPRRSRPLHAGPQERRRRRRTEARGLPGAPWAIESTQNAPRKNRGCRPTGIATPRQSRRKGGRVSPRTMA
jgi:hypothetical protein